MSVFPLELRLFGPFAATVSGEPLPPLRTRKGHSLLALLALRQGRKVSREWLAGTLWPDSEESQAYYNLRQCLSNLRHALGTAADCLQSPTTQTLCLSSEKAWCDVTVYSAFLAEGSAAALKQAVALYRGQLMEGSGEECFFVERTAHEQTYLAALETLAVDASSHNSPTAAVRYLRLMLAADPFREAACGALMEALADCGDYAAVRQVYRDLRLLLHRELSTTPALETKASYQRLMERSKQPFPFFTPSLRDTSLPPCRLPVPLTQLIGREREIETVTTLLQTNRLVTLIGAGGIGKTRLALAVGEARAQKYQGGIWFVEFAALSDAEQVPQTVAKALEIVEQAGKSLVETLTEALAVHSVLIILDNAEHLLEACTLLTDRLLALCPCVHLLVTSRQPLGLMGEQIYRVPSLPLPVAGMEEKSEETSTLLEYAGVRLFVERAMQWKTGFCLTRQNAAFILQICQRLDGIPLAIELAAARMRSLSVEEVNVRLQDRFALLIGGSRADLPRHQTLRALIDWSYDLLTESEQKLLRHLSVFAGGWTIMQAEQVCEESEQNTFSFILDGLTSLVDKSLIIADTQGKSTRYRMLETVRQYANEKLRESGEWQTVSRRHCVCFMAMAEEADAPKNTAKQGQWLALLENEYDNLRAALLWCREESEDETEKRIVTALYTFWHLRGYPREGRDALLHAASKAAQCGDIALQAHLLLKAGALARLLGDFPQTQSLLIEVLTLAKTVGDLEAEANSLLLLGSVALTEGSNSKGVALIEQALDVAYRIGDHGIQSECLVWQGDAARWRGDLAAAQGFYEAGLEAACSLNVGWFEACATGMMAEVALLQGDTSRASFLAQRAWQGYVEVGDKTYCVLILDTFAGIALEQGEPERAASLLAFVDALTQTLQTPLPFPEQEKHLLRLAAAQLALDSVTFDAAYSAGYRLNWEQIAAYALIGNRGYAN